MFNFNDLPNELKYQVIQHLPCKDLGNMAQVNKECKELSEVKEIWKKVAEREFSALFINKLPCRINIDFQSYASRNQDIRQTALTRVNKEINEESKSPAYGRMLGHLFLNFKRDFSITKNNLKNKYLKQKEWVKNYFSAYNLYFVPFNNKQYSGSLEENIKKVKDPCPFSLGDSYFHPDSRFDC